MLKIAVLGSGRMARSIIQVIKDSPGCQTSSVWVHDSSKVSEYRDAAGLDGAEQILVSDDLAQVLDKSDLAIDFTLANATSTVIEHVLLANKALICGVSGLDQRLQQSLRSAAERIPVFYDRNMSYGIAVLTGILKDAGAAFVGEFEIEIHESHHKHKKDAPSGTALSLGETLAASMGRKFEDVYFYDPAGNRPDSPGKISFYVSREGEIAGDHKVIFKSPSETIEISHSVADRRVFAEGAVKAAVWLADQTAGLYRMSDLLND